VLIQVGFDGMPDGEKYTALCVLSKNDKVSDVISWLYRRVFNTDAVAQAAAGSVPFTLYRNGLLLPEVPISAFASPPTAKIMCRVNLPPGSQPPFRPEIIKGSTEFIHAVRHLFPAKKMTKAEESRIAKLKQDQRRQAALALFQQQLRSHPEVQPEVTLAAGANVDVEWRVEGGGKTEKTGRLTCDQLRDYLNQGHFDDPSEYGKLLGSYQFSFDMGATWMSSLKHSVLLKRINAEALSRCLHAVTHTLRATVRAALLTLDQPATMIDVAINNDESSLSSSSPVGSLSFALPLLPQLREGMAREKFQEQISLADERRAAKPNATLAESTRLFTSAPPSRPVCDVTHCDATYDSPQSPLRVTLCFPSFLNLDLIMGDKGGLQKELEHIIFNFYFEQKLAQPRGGE